MHYKQFKLCLLVTMALLTFNAQAVIYEVKSVVEMQQHLKDVPGDALCVIDIDETVIMSAQFLGSSKWFYTHQQESLSHTKNAELVYSALIRKYMYIHEHNQMQLVEGEHTLNFIESLHAQHHVLYVTSRDARMVDATERQFNQTNLRYNHSPFFKNKDVHLGLFGDDDGIYNSARNGVIYAQGGDKGICLEKYLQAIDCDATKFSYIVGIDDKEKNLLQLEQAAKRLNLPFIGFRYGAADQFVQQEVDLQIANVQYNVHKRNPSNGFISDTAASKFLEH